MKTNLLPVLSMPGGNIPIKEVDVREQKLAILFIAIYVIANITYGLMASAPWDDDCVTRFYNTKKAIQEPQMFFSLWNRPLFVILFFPIAQIGPTAMMLQMITITGLSGYFLYKAMVGMGFKHPSLVLPLFFFQTYFFSVSRNNLTEPLAVAIICLGLYCLVKKRYLWFAITGSLLPLARLELSVLLVIWGLILVIKGQWKYLWVLALPTLLVDVIGSFYKGGDMLWMVNETFGREDEENRYGHTDFWSYFRRYIFVAGPIVFYFLLIGLFERVSRMKIDLFVFGQFLLGFILYVVFSWKLNMGNAAGFLRNLIPLTPLVAIIALYGLHSWLNTLKYLKIDKEKEKIIGTASEEVIKVNQYQRKGKHKKMSEERIRKKRERKHVEELKKAKKKYLLDFSRTLLFSLCTVAIGFIFYATSIKMHHKLTGETDYTNPIVMASVAGVLLLLTLLRRWLADRQWLVYLLGGVLLVGTSSYTMITEPPDAHLSPEREVLGRLAKLYSDSYLRINNPLYVNHLWFFWSSGLDYPSAEFRVLNKDNIESAPKGSIMIWESHYSGRIFGDVNIEYVENNPELVELCRMLSKDNKFTVVMFQKVDSTADKSVYAERFINTYPDFAYGYFSRAKLHFEDEHYDKALADLNKVIELDTSFVHVYFTKGLIFHKTREYEKASKCFQRVADALPKYYQANYNAGITLAAQRKYEIAIPYLERVIEYKKDYWSAYEQLGLAYFNLGKYASAIKYYNDIAAGLPNNALNYFNRANCLFKQQRYKEAIADYNRSIELQPDYALAYFNKALSLGYLQRKDEACKALLKSAKLGYAKALAMHNINCKQASKN